MDKAYQEYLVQKRQEEQRQGEEKRKEAERVQKAYQENLAHQRQSELLQAEEQRQREQRLAEERRRQIERKAAALPNIQIVESKVTCTSSLSCMNKYGTIVVKNASAETITRIDLGWTILPRNDRNSPCTSHHETKKSIRLRIPAGETASFNFETSDGPWDGTFRYCININDIEVGGR